MRVSQNVYALRNVILAPERHLKECNQNTVCLCINIEMYLQDIYFKISTLIKVSKVQRNPVPCHVYNDWIRISFTAMRKKKLGLRFYLQVLICESLT